MFYLGFLKLISFPPNEIITELSPDVAKFPLLKKLIQPPKMLNKEKINYKKRLAFNQASSFMFFQLQ